MRRLAGGERVTNFDTVRMRRDGRLIHVSLSISPMVDEAGTIIGASTIARDVTEQRQAERLYRISQERLRFTLRAARVGTWDWNLETGEVIWSDNLEEIHGRLPGTFGGSIESVMEDLHPDDRPAVEQAVRRSLEDDERYDVEYRVLRHDGSEGWLQGRGQVTRDWNGRPVSMSGMCQDITDRKRAQQELQQELAERRRAEEDLKRLNDTLEERVASRTNLLRMLNHVATAANAATDGDAVFQICLDQVCSYTGWELGHVYLYDDVRSELTPLGVWRLDEQARFQGFRDATLAAPIGLDDPLLGQAFRQGRPIWLANSEPAAAFQRWDVAAKAGLKSAMAIPVLAGDRAAAVLEFHSTDAVQPDDDLLDAMRQVAAQLGRVVERSQVRRLEEKMRHAQKLESLGVLAGGIAHDFNNLLTAVLGYTELALRQTPADSPLQELLGQVRTAALQAAELCNQMLAYSGQGRFVVEPVDLSKLLRDMGNLLSVSISKKAHVEFDLAVDLADDLARVQGDPAQLRQIVMNLMTNASDALEDKPGTITVRTGAAQLRGAHPSDLLAAENLPAGDYVFLEIADTGCGMDEETCAKMFDPFFTTKFTGRGLGMAAVLGIVRGHGGLIRVQSEPGQGTVIRVYFPGSSAVPKQQVIRAHPDRSFAWRRHILIVDDDPSVLRVTTLLLESFGFRVSQANNGHEAVEAIRRRPHEFAMVLLDLTMPEMSGHEALSEIRAIRSDLPVLLASGYREQDAVHRVPGERPTAFIQKPFEFDVLMAKMRQVLDGAAGKS
jgi:PAS domain S-box-containing protein